MKQVAKYGKLGKYFPYCIRHRAVKTTTVKLVTEKNSPTNWILFIQFMVGESRHFHLCPPGKTLPQIIIITSNTGQKEITNPPRQSFFGKSIPTAGRGAGAAGGGYVSYYKHISVQPLMSKVIEKVVYDKINQVK